MEKLFDQEVKDNRSRIKLLTIICHLMPVMEAVDRLKDAVSAKKKRDRKEQYDLKYWKHEVELMEMDQRIFNDLMKKRNEQKPG
jgi:hypothetical protein